MNVTKIVVECEKLLAKLERSYPNLMKHGGNGFWTITGAGAGYTLNQIASSAKSHDPKGDSHTVHQQQR